MKNNKPLTMRFIEINASDLPLVGGKGANLGELTQAGFPVPPGFCVTTHAFTEFLNSSNASEKVYALLDNANPKDMDNLRKVGQEIRAILTSSPIPQSVSQATISAWQETGTNEAYAVRSSATAEDLPDASFAGQQDTYLNILGESELLEAIRNCWVSLFTDRAISYRFQNNFPHREVQLSVVIQKMVMAETSGILFTADPLTGYRHTLSIDASFGLGEALVGGIVSPDAYQVDKRNLTIINRQIADKKIAIYPLKEGGTRQENLSPEQQKKTVLSDTQIIKLAKMGNEIEAHYGNPQDIEWSFAENQLYLLQSRPITSLYPIEGLKSSDGALHIYFSMGHQQNMTDTMVPLAMSSMQSVIPVSKTENGESSLFKINGSRMFADLTTALRHPIFRRGVLNGISMLDARAPDILKLAIQRPEFKHPHGIKISTSTLKIGVQVFSSIMNALWKQDYSGFLPKINGIISTYNSDLKTEIDKTNSSKEKVVRMQNALMTVHTVLFNWGAQMIAGEIAKRMLLKLASKDLNLEELEALSLGLPCNAVTDMNVALGDIADAARQSPELVEWFSKVSTDSKTWLTQAKGIKNSEPFFNAFNQFIADYGARGSSEIDIYQPRWYEEPLPLLKVIASNLQNEPKHHRNHLNQLIKQRETATKKLLANAKGIRKRLLKRLIYVMEHGSVLREHHKFLVIQVFRIAKEMLKEISLDLVQANKLSKPDDIWFLTWPELITIWDEKSNAFSKRIIERRQDYHSYKKMLPPLIITSDGEAPVVHYKVENAPENALLGNPVSPGVVEGIVRIIHDPNTETLNAGEIMVAVFTDPGWTPLFINAGGLIMEIGGAMTHGSVVAREYGIPAIVGVNQATKLLKTGQRVRVDGSRGIVEVL